jgi:hypothetical protein
MQAGGKDREYGTDNDNDNDDGNGNDNNNDNGNDNDNDNDGNTELLDNIRKISKKKSNIDKNLSKYGDKFRGHVLKERAAIGYIYTIIFVIISLAFMIMPLIVIADGIDNDSKTTIWSLYVVNILCQLLNIMFLVYLQSKIPLVLLSIIRFALGIWMLSLTETSGITSCVKDVTTYRVYMASHCLNVVLFFLGIIPAMF